jgi:hypothetical protein
MHGEVVPGAERDLRRNRHGRSAIYSDLRAPPGFGIGRILVETIGDGVRADGHPTLSRIRRIRKPAIERDRIGNAVRALNAKWRLSADRRVEIAEGPKVQVDRVDVTRLDDGRSDGEWRLCPCADHPAGRDLFRYDRRVDFLLAARPNHVFCGLLLELRFHQSGEATSASGVRRGGVATFFVASADRRRPSGRQQGSFS